MHFNWLLVFLDLLLQCLSFLLFCTCERMKHSLLNACCSYYSMHGHFKKLDEEIKRGAASLEVEAQLSQVCNCRSLQSGTVRDNILYLIDVMTTATCTFLIVIL
ncbi:putative Flavoprotein [Rosa chinensis]|uniref:Putative Flavoprotein n=1 Tax=Rosa chinensis TaxID=74649 RepID=A0A2P6S8Y5_ROSCH|nr:putative Flavoprotein [Rosa chinensis]